jgi:5'-nucleotidase
MRFRYDLTRPHYDAVTQIELGDLARGYRAIDISERSTELHSLACNLYLGIILAQIPTKTTGALAVAPKKRDGTPLRSRAEALPTAQSGPYLLPPKGTIDRDEVVHGPGAAASQEIKEWQAIMNYLKSLPTKNAQGVTTLSMDDRVNENRAINTRS